MLASLECSYGCPPRGILKQLTTKPTLVAAALLLVACVTAPPVQEMSDARQAIRAAEETGSQGQGARLLASARRMMEQAQLKLEAGAYGDARRLALDARDEAIRAREMSRDEEGR